MQTRHRINWAELVLILIISIAVVGCLKKTEPPVPTEETASNEEVVEEKVVVEEGCIAVPESAKDSEEQGYTAVEVFFATDRNQLQPGETPKYFGVERSDLKYGVCSVSIPRDHRMGELEAPGRFLFWRLKEDPQYHIVTLNAVVLPSDIYFDHLQSQIMNCDHKSALIFFHGFNVTLMMQHAALHRWHMTSASRAHQSSIAGLHKARSRFTLLMNKPLNGPKPTCDDSLKTSLRNQTPKTFILSATAWERGG